MMTIDTLEQRKGFNLDKYVGIDKRAILRNCVEPETGLHILNEAMNKTEIVGNQKNLF
jgi:hypothetical protein